MGFSAIDYVVLAAYLVGITIFGSRFRKSHRSVKDYFLGSRQTSWVVISLSIVATETSTLTLIGVPALASVPAAGTGGISPTSRSSPDIVARFVISAVHPGLSWGRDADRIRLIVGSGRTPIFSGGLFPIMRAGRGRACSPHPWCSRRC